VMEQPDGKLPEPDEDDALDEDDSADLSNQAMPGTPVYKLEQEYEGQ